jgi:hypothetical protein
MDRLVEQFNATLQSMLRMYIADNQCNWDTYLPYVLAAYWSTMHDVTQDTPFFLVYMQDHYLPLNVSLSLPWQEQFDTVAKDRRKLVCWLADTFQAAQQCQMEVQEHNHFYYNWGQT